MSYQESYRRSLEDPEGFWGEAAQALHWDRPWDKVLDDSNKPFYRWFAGGMLNTCYNAVDRHVEAGRGEQAAIIYDSPVTGTKQVIGYRELQDRVARFDPAREFPRAGLVLDVVLERLQQAIVGLVAVALVLIVTQIPG